MRHPPVWALRPPRSLHRPGRAAEINESVAGQRILLTGASSGIGRAAAVRLAAAGAHLILVARRADELKAVCAEIAAAGGSAEYRCCDVSDTGDVDRLVEWILPRYSPIDVLVNNAGRSIRRPLTESLDRFHDFERTVALNYLGPVRLTLALLPAMLEHGSGHIVNVGTATSAADTAPNFAAYFGSKSALAAFSRTANAELAGTGIAVTSVNYPFVRTPMIAPTASYANLPVLSSAEAAEWIVTAIRKRPVRIEPRYARSLRVLGAFAPRTVDRIVRRSGV
ncbi:SDR family NAD(P)-dependent oxidoreductase [Nocardia sp. NPDC057030]|uniref:SDR family NAD(P)-dependent oxidoreductase n=1 Tax=unclassified Nocardia TaxID=2637762 RepID=UPI00363BB777